MKRLVQDNNQQQPAYKRMKPMIWSEERNNTVSNEYLFEYIPIKDICNVILNYFTRTSVEIVVNDNVNFTSGLCVISLQYNNLQKIPSEENIAKTFLLALNTVLPQRHYAGEIEKPTLPSLIICDEILGDDVVPRSLILLHGLEADYFYPYIYCGHVKKPQVCNINISLELANICYQNDFFQQFSNNVIITALNPNDFALLWIKKIGAHGKYAYPEWHLQNRKTTSGIIQKPENSFDQELFYRLWMDRKRCCSLSINCTCDICRYVDDHHYCRRIRRYQCSEYHKCLCPCEVCITTKQHCNKTGKHCYANME